MLKNEIVEAGAAEMMKAWTLIRQDHPTDTETNAQRILKDAFTTLNSDPNAVVCAEGLRQMYSKIR